MSEQEIKNIRKTFFNKLTQVKHELLRARKLLSEIEQAELKLREEDLESRNPLEHLED